MKSHHQAGLFLLGCLVVLFMPGIGDLRWIGLLAFIYVGLPWYILAVRDRTSALRDLEAAGRVRWRPRSPTLFVFGLISAFLGVAIDLFLVYMAIQDPNPTNIVSLLIRLMLGLPFFGFGFALVYLSLGIGRSSGQNEIR